jgi:hypothetical protein
MMTTWKVRLLALLLGAFALPGVYAQEAGEDAAPEQPEPRSLESGWWSYFDGSRDEVAPRVDSFLEAVTAQVTDLQPANEPVALPVLDAVRDNLGAYLVLLDEDELDLIELPPPALTYSIDDYLKLAAAARNASAEAAEENLEVEREQRILDGASRRRDLAFKVYVDTPSGDARFLAGLRLIQTRSAQAISARRLELLTQRYERSAARARAAAERVDLAGARLAISGETNELDGLLEAIATAEASVAKAEERLRDARLAAIGLDLDTQEGRSQQRLQQQKLLDAEVLLTVEQAELAQVQARRWWAELQLDAAADMSVIQEQSLGWSELRRSVEENAPEWRRIAEDELLAVQTASRDGLSRALRRLLDQRLGTAQGTLQHVADAETAVADLALLSSAVDNTMAEYSGAFVSWLSNAKRQLNPAIRESLTWATKRCFPWERHRSPAVTSCAFLLFLQSRSCCREAFATRYAGSAGPNRAARRRRFTRWDGSPTTRSLSSRRSLRCHRSASTSATLRWSQARSA